MSRATVRAAAKINLHLGVGAPRPDGFHPLETVYQAISLYDDVTVDLAASGVRLDGSEHVDLTSVPTDAANIAVRAVRAVAQAAGAAAAVGAVGAVDSIYGCLLTRHDSDVGPLWPEKAGIER